jgi:hypothetical protein
VSPVRYELGFYILEDGILYISIQSDGKSKSQAYTFNDALALEHLRYTIQMAGCLILILSKIRAFFVSGESVLHKRRELCKI